MMAKDATIQYIMDRTHSRQDAWTTQIIADELGVTRQTIAPYVTELINDGHLRRILCVGFTRGPSVQIFTSSCRIIQYPFEVLKAAINTAGKVMLSIDIEHPSQPNTIYIDKHWLAALNGKVWVPNEMECRLCNFSFNNYRRAKSAPTNLTKYIF
jgi:hypothetical protein